MLDKLSVAFLIRLSIVGQGPTALAVGAGWGGLDIFSLIYHFSLLSPSLWETARYRLQYCLKGLFNPKQTTNHKNVNISYCFLTKLKFQMSGYGKRFVGF